MWFFVLQTFNTDCVFVVMWRVMLHCCRTWSTTIQVSPHCLHYICLCLFYVCLCLCFHVCFVNCVKKHSFYESDLLYTCTSSKKTPMFYFSYTDKHQEMSEWWLWYKDPWNQNCGLQVSQSFLLWMLVISLSIIDFTNI
jgi:hypothetical protein